MKLITLNILVANYTPEEDIEAALKEAIASFGRNGCNPCSSGYEVEENANFGGEK